jgi:hypothetical protein
MRVLEQRRINFARQQKSAVVGIRASPFLDVTQAKQNSGRE